MDDLTLVTMVAVVLMCATAWLLVAYIGANKAAKARQEEINRLEKIGRSLYLYIKDDLTTGKSAFSFYGGGSARTFEVWRNERLDREARPLIRQWEERHTYAGSNVEPARPRPVPFDPSGLDAVGKASMEYQPVVPEAWREKTETGWRDIDPKEERG